MTGEPIQRPRSRRDKLVDSDPAVVRKGLFGLGRSDDARPEVQTGAETEMQVGYSATIDPSGASPIPATGSGAPAEDVPGAPAKTSLFSRKAEDRKGTWGDSGYHATDEEAHRDVRYRIPSFIGQTGTMFMVQMKLYSKMKWTYFMLFMAILIPVITIALDDIFDMMSADLGSSTAYTGLLLAMTPIMLGFFTAVLSGPSIGREFKDRTAYMNVSLPVSRVSFYMGKYLAGFVLSLGIFMFAYGMAVATAMSHYDYIFADIIGESMLAMAVSLFAYSATAFCIGSFSRKPSTLTPFVLMTFILPAVLTVINLRYGADSLMLLPCFLPDVSISLLGTPMIGSVAGFLSMIGFSLVDTGQMWTMVGIGAVWGLAFLLLGMIKTKRREM